MPSVRSSNREHNKDPFGMGMGQKHDWGTPKESTEMFRVGQAGLNCFNRTCVFLIACEA